MPISCGVYVDQALPLGAFRLIHLPVENAKDDTVFLPIGSRFSSHRKPRQATRSLSTPLMYSKTTAGAYLHVIIILALVDDLQILYLNI